MLDLTQLTDHDKRLLGSVIGIVLGLTGAGENGVAALIPLSKSNPKEWKAIRACLNLLVVSQEGMDLHGEYEPSTRVMSANLSRLAEIGVELIREQVTRVNRKQHETF